MTRRTVLAGSAALAAAVLTACTPQPEPSTTASPTTEPDVDAQVRANVAVEESAIIALYDAVIVAHPDLAAQIAPLRDEHLSHADAMAVAIPQATAPAVGSRPQAIASLIEAEQQAIAQRTAACESTVAEEISRTLALIAASEAGHAEFLRGLA